MTLDKGGLTDSTVSYHDELELGDRLSVLEGKGLGELKKRPILEFWLAPFYNRNPFRYNYKKFDPGVLNSLKRYS